MTPAPAIRSQRLRPTGGFTLIELVLVMTILATILALTATSLSRFFKGRSLDSEARRFLSLTRYAQARATSDGIPAILWIDSEKRLYGVRPEFRLDPSAIPPSQIIPGLLPPNPRDPVYPLPENFEIQFEYPRQLQNVSLRPAQMGAFPQLNPAQQQNPNSQTLLSLRFDPSGLLNDSHPARILLKQIDPNSSSSASQRDPRNSEVWITPKRNRMSYQISTNDYETLAALR